MDPGLMIAYGAILTMATVPIFIGAHRSLNQKATETLSTQHAWTFPFVGSAFLFGLYMLFKLFSKEYINLLLTGYFVIFAVGSLTATISPSVQFFLPHSSRGKFVTITFYLSSGKNEIELTMAEVISVVISVFVAGWYFWQKDWITNNIIGLSFCIQAITILSMGSYKVGIILLSGLFIYDVFWVFGTDVMVTVARSFDAPIKLLFPKDIFAETLQFSMLGLGDIVIPGFLIALLLRFDQKKKQMKSSKGSKKDDPHPEKKFDKTYFNVTFFSYILGLSTTIAVMHFFKAAQPALLYLVPFCIGASTITALVRGEFSLLWSYSEEESETNKSKPANNNKAASSDKTEEENAEVGSPVSEKKKKKKKEATPASPPTKPLKKSQK